MFSSIVVIIKIINVIEFKTNCMQYTFRNIFKSLNLPYKGNIARFSIYMSE